MANISPSPYFLSLHTDILNVIVLHSIDAGPDPPTLDALKTLLSLLVCCKQLYRMLSRTYNPFLYSDIFCLMWDVEPLRRRFGHHVITSSILAHQLLHRSLLLRKFLRCVHDLEKDDEVQAITTPDLITLFLWMTENDGRNMFQIQSFLGATQLGDLLFALLTRQLLFYNREQGVSSYPDLGITVAVLWMNTDCASQSFLHWSILNLKE